MAHLYFAEDLQSDVFLRGATLEVTGSEARHAVKVSRLRVGEHIRVGNGVGTVGAGAVVAVDANRFVMRVDTVERTEPSTPRVWLVQALAKGDRAERAVELATEFGVHGIVPWQAARSIARWDEAKQRQGQQKWARIAREASKQSMRAWVPVVAPLTRTSDLIVRARSTAAHLVVLDPRADRPLSEWASSITGGAEIWLCVGPEGGISAQELDELQSANAHVVRLGPEVLRTSSAGPAALAVLQTALGRW